MQSKIRNWIDEVIIELEIVVSDNDLVKSAEILQDFRIILMSEMAKLQTYKNTGKTNHRINSLQ